MYLILDNLQITKLNEMIILRTYFFDGKGYANMEIRCHMAIDVLINSQKWN